MVENEAIKGTVSDETGLKEAIASNQSLIEIEGNCAKSSTDKSHRCGSVGDSSGGCGGYYRACCKDLFYITCYFRRACGNFCGF